MSQTASFLTDYLFPGLLIGCGCLGLGVVNALGQSSAPSRKEAPPASSPAATPRAAPRARAAMPASQAVRVRAMAQPRVAPLRPMVRPTQQRLDFGKRQTRVTDGHREQLRIFLAAAKLGPGARVRVVAFGAGRREKKQAQKRAQRVVALLRQLGVAAASIAEPQVVTGEDGANQTAVTIMIGKQ